MCYLNVLICHYVLLLNFRTFEDNVMRFSLLKRNLKYLLSQRSNPATLELFGEDISQRCTMRGAVSMFL